MFKKIMLFAMVLGLVSIALAEDQKETFDTCLGTFNLEVGNRVGPDGNPSGPGEGQNFGWSYTKNADPNSDPSGELGGIFQRTDKDYAYPFPYVANGNIGIFDINDTLVIRGKARMTDLMTWDGGVQIGYFKQGTDPASAQTQIGISLGEPKPGDGYPYPRIFIRCGNNSKYAGMVPVGKMIDFDLTYALIDDLNNIRTLYGTINGVDVFVSGNISTQIDAFGVSVSSMSGVDTYRQVKIYFDDLEFTGKPAIGFETTAVANEENAVTNYDIVVRSYNAAKGGTYTVDYAVIGGTADANDYTLTPGTLTFEPNETSKTFSIAINNDGINEEDETIIVGLSDPCGPNASLINPVFTYTIIDPRPKITFASARSEAPENISPVQIPVNLLKPAIEPVSVDYAVTGGTADNNYFTLAAGTLTFEVNEATKYITMDVVDNSVITPDVNVIITLSNPRPVNSCSLGAIRQFTYTILDNDLGVYWENKHWYFDQVPSKLFINSYGDLELDTPRGDDGFMTCIADSDLSRIGDVVEVSYIYSSDGSHDCNDCFRCPNGCANDDITCMDGTSDMRFGLFQSNGSYRYGDRKGPDTVVGYLGYAFRFGPHLPPDPTRYVDNCGEVHKTGQFGKKPYAMNDLLMNNEGLLDGIPGFELEPNVPAILNLRLERTGPNDVKLSITLNNRTYTMTDTDGTDQPQKIDVFAWGMRNNRNYTRMVLGSTLPPECPGDLNNDLNVNDRDLEIVAAEWLRQETAEIMGTAPDTSKLLLNYKFEGTAGVDIPAGAGMVPNLAPGGLFALTKFVDTSSGTNKGALKYGAPNPVTGTGTSADYQNPFSDPGTGLYAKDTGTNTAIDLLRDTFTVEAFIKPSTVRASVIIKKHNIPTSRWYLDLKATGEMAFAIGGDVAPNAVFTGAGSIVADTWYHVVGVFDKNTTKSMIIYLDGKEVGSSQYKIRPAESSLALGVGCIVRDNPTPPAGSTNSGAFFDGLIDELRVYGYALSKDEVFYQANGGTVVIDKPLVSKAELIADNIIDLKDFAAFAQYWLEECQ